MVYASLVKAGILCGSSYVIFIVMLLYVLLYDGVNDDCDVLIIVGSD